MANNDFSWTDASNELEGQGFARFQIELANYNARHLIHIPYGPLGVTTSKNLPG